MVPGAACAVGADGLLLGPGHGSTCTFPSGTPAAIWSRIWRSLASALLSRRFSRVRAERDRENQHARQRYAFASLGCPQEQQGITTRPLR